MKGKTYTVEQQRDFCKGKRQNNGVWKFLAYSTARKCLTDQRLVNSALIIEINSMLHTI